MSQSTNKSLSIGVYRNERRTVINLNAQEHAFFEQVCAQQGVGSVPRFFLELSRTLVPDPGYLWARQLKIAAAKRLGVELPPKKARTKPRAEATKDYHYWLVRVYKPGARKGDYRPFTTVCLDAVEGIHLARAAMRQGYKGLPDVLRALSLELSPKEGVKWSQQLREEAARRLGMAS